jgi:outer membrane protein
MKRLFPALHFTSLLGVGLLFFLFFKNTRQEKKTPVTATAAPGAGPRIAYFDIDSLQAHYNYFRDALQEAKRSEDAMNLELSNLHNKNQKKVLEWQQKSQAMTPAEREQANTEFEQMQKYYDSRKRTLEQYQLTRNEDLMADIKKRIGHFLEEYNKQTGYAFIFAYDPGSFMYYKDSSYNITAQVVDGLNAAYKKDQRP